MEKDITLNKTFLDSLSVGNHTFEVKEKAKPTPSPQPKMTVVVVVPNTADK